MFFWLLWEHGGQGQGGIVLWSTPLTILVKEKEGTKQVGFNFECVVGNAMAYVCDKFE